MSDRLLLVETDATLCGQLERFLSTLGYTVQTASSVGGALAALRGRDIDIVLMDSQLDEDPATIAFAAKRADAALVMMGRAELVDALVIDIGVELSTEFVLHKPFSAQVLADSVSAALTTRRERIALEAQRKQQESTALDAQLGELKAALDDLGSLVDEVIESTPPDEIRYSSGARLRPDEVVSALEPEVLSDFDAHDLFAPDTVDQQALITPDGSVGPAPVAPASPSTPSIDAAPRRVRASVELLDDAALPPPPAESAELLAQFALRPLAPTTPLDPRGIYGPVTMPELLYNCFRDLFSGWLILRQPPIAKTVLLRSGRPIFATSNVRGETLGALLMSRGRLTADDVERIEAHRDARDVRQGQAIVELGLLSEDDVRQALRDQVSTRIVECFAWTGASYGLRYDPDAAEGIEPFEINPLVLIFTGIKSRFPLAPLLAHYDKVIKQAPTITSRLSDYATMLRGHAEDLQVAQLCNGERALGEVLALSPLNLVDTLRVVRALEAMSCLVYADPPKRVRSVRHSTGPRDITRSTGSFRQVRPVQRSSEPGRVRRKSQPPRAERRTSSAPKPETRTTGGRSIRRAGERTTGGFRKVGSRSGSTAQSRTTSKAPASRPRRVSGSMPVVESRSGPPASRATEGEGLIARLEAAETHYALLGVQPNASRGAISSAAAGILRKLSGAAAAELPEELQGRARQQVQRVSQAGEVLSNPHRRRTYDALHLPIGEASGPDLIAAELNFKRGRICVVNELVERARAFFELAAVQDPHQAIYQVYLAWATFRLTDPNDRRARGKALELAKEALKIDSSRDDGFVLLGGMHREHGAHDSAVRAYQRALEVNGGNTEARKALLELEGGGEEKKDTRLFGKLFVRR